MCVILAILTYQFFPDHRSNLASGRKSWFRRSRLRRNIISTSMNCLEGSRFSSTGVVVNKSERVFSAFVGQMKGTKRKLQPRPSLQFCAMERGLPEQSVLKDRQVCKYLRRSFLCEEQTDVICSEGPSLASLHC